jgi:rubredoxin
MILRYTCTKCGIVTRAEEGESHASCACLAPFDVVEDDVQPMFSRDDS